MKACGIFDPLPGRSRLSRTAAALVFSISIFWCAQAASDKEVVDPDPRRAAVLMLEGTAEWTLGGVTKPVTVGLLVPPGSLLKTGKKSEMVLFFRQIGTMVRLREESTIVLETMTKFMKDEVLLKETVLDLKAGEMMCVVRVLDENSKFEVKFQDMVAAFDGAGFGRFDISAKGTVLVGRKSERPFRVSTIGKSERTILVPPGYFLSRTTSVATPASKKALDDLRPKLDVLENLAKALTPPPRQEELRRKKPN